MAPADVVCGGSGAVESVQALVWRSSVHWHDTPRGDQHHSVIGWLLWFFFSLSVVSFAASSATLPDSRAHFSPCIDACMHATCALAGARTTEYRVPTDKITQGLHLHYVSACSQLDSISIAYLYLPCLVLTPHKCKMLQEFVIATNDKRGGAAQRLQVSTSNSNLTTGVALSWELRFPSRFGHVGKLWR
jgi:hypothetical protein